MLQALNLKQWVDEHRDLLKPPIGNKLIWQDSDFLVMVVGGPNKRTDYHVDACEELFYQIEGDIVLKVIENNKSYDILIKEGDIFLLPPNIPHSPQRPANTVGLVVERRCKDTELDGFQWYCENCGEKLYEEFVHISDIETQLQTVFDRFFDTADNCTCKACGTVATRPL